MAGRVTKDPDLGDVIDLASDGQASVEEQLQEPEVVEALAVDPEDARLADPEEAVASTADASTAVAPDDEGAPAPVEAGAERDPEIPEFLPRYVRPSDAAKEHVLKRVMAGMVEIDGVIVDDAGQHWQGVKVVPVAWIISVAVEALPAPNAFNSEVQSGAAITVWVKCSDCGGLYPDQGTFGSEYKSVEMNGVPKRTLKSKWKSEGMSHVCGQAVLPLATPPAHGQTEAFAATAEMPVADPEPELDAEARVELENDVVKLLDRVEREVPVDDDSIGIPPEEDVRAWSTHDLQRVYEWAWSRVNLEADQPPVPAVLRRDVELVVVATEPVVEDEMGCSHEGRGLPGCPVCDPEGVMEREVPTAEAEGTGDPDGALLP